MKVSYELAKVLFIASTALLRCKLGENSSPIEKYKKDFAFLKVELSKEDFNLLDHFKDEIRVALEPYSDDGAFVRLSSLSPKDSVLEDPEYLFPFIVKEMESLDDIYNKYSQEQAVAIAIGKALKGNIVTSSINVYLFCFIDSFIS